jgi:hypothetical protein
MLPLLITWDGFPLSKGTGLSLPGSLDNTTTRSDLCTEMLVVQILTDLHHSQQAAPVPRSFSLPHGYHSRAFGISGCCLSICATEVARDESLQFTGSQEAGFVATLTERVTTLTERLNANIPTLGAQLSVGTILRGSQFNYCHCFVLPHQWPEAILMNPNGTVSIRQGGSGILHNDSQLPFALQNGMVIHPMISGTDGQSNGASVSLVLTFLDRGTRPDCMG